MPGKNYSNITVRASVREELDRLRGELGVRDLSDLVMLLVHAYRQYASISSRLDELLTRVSSILSPPATSNTSILETPAVEAPATRVSSTREEPGGLVPVDSPAFELDSIICSYDPKERKSYCFDRSIVVELIRDLNRRRASYDDAEKDPRVKLLYRLDILCTDGTHYWWICSERKDDPEFTG
jgi:hypothetical protein